MHKHRLALQDNALGLVPEQVLVLETIGPIQNFMRAVQKVSGLEWLGEHELDDIPPEHGFADDSDPEKPLKGHVFLVMTDQQALSQLHNLFVLWKKDKDIQFERGLAPLKHAFRHLHRIRPWNIDDRIRDTGILDDWKQRLNYGEETVPFEVELWFRVSPERRRLAESHVRDIVTSNGGHVGRPCVITEIAYHALFGQLPRAHIERIRIDTSAYEDIRLLQCEDVMRSLPVGACALPVPHDPMPQSDAAVGSVPPLSFEAPIEGSPILALLDGMPQSKHQLLDQRLVVDDPDGYEATYQAHERLHGTQMTSLICHGDLNLRESPLDRQIYVRPILQPQRGFDGLFAEAIPPDVLPVDLIHRAVHRLFEGDGDEPPAAPTVLFINLSVCDRNRPLIREMSSLARLLDWLSWKYHILFLVSAGNHPQDIEIGILPQSLSTLSPDEVERAVIRALSDDTRNRRLLSPAETVNGLTVGALHQDDETPVTGHQINPFEQNAVPSVISAHGPGYRRAVKPDILLPGGRQLLIERLGSTGPKATLQVLRSASVPGQKVAAPGKSGRLDAIQYGRGTSNATALASRGAALIFEMIDRLRQQPGMYLPPEYDVVLTKALLAHSAQWSSAKPRFESALKDGANPHTFREHVGRFLGYGAINLARVMNCTEERVTVLGFGEIDDGEGAVFSLPLPPCLSTVNAHLRLTITLAWLTPVHSLRREYRIAHLWFNPNNPVAPERCLPTIMRCSGGLYSTKSWKAMGQERFKMEIRLR